MARLNFTLARSTPRISFNLLMSFGPTAVKAGFPCFPKQRYTPAIAMVSERLATPQSFRQNRLEIIA
jgi:hypothetical protein